MAFIRPITPRPMGRLLAAATFGGVLLGSAPAFAQTFLERPLMGGLTALGIVAPDKDPIEYHQRAPLVVPRAMDLPPPAAEHVSERAPNWPADPNIAQKLKEKAAAQEPSMSPPENPKLSIWTMIAGRSNSQPINPAGPGSQAEQPNYYSGWMRPGALRTQSQQIAAGNPSNADDIRPGHEPKRRFLTDPPTGYRVPDAKASFKRGYAAPIKKKDDGNVALQYQIDEAKRNKGLAADGDQ